MYKIHKWLILGVMVLIMISITSCGTMSNTRPIMNSWVGANADDLIKHFGIPDRDYILSSGERLIEYSRSTTVRMPGFNTQQPIYNNQGIKKGYQSVPGPGFSANKWCVATFMVNKNNIITQWKVNGNRIGLRHGCESTVDDVRALRNPRF